MAITLKVDAVDVTADVELSSLTIEKTASRLNPLCNFILRDERPVSGLAALAIREKQEVEVLDGATPLFGGTIGGLSPSRDGLAVENDVTAQGFTSYLRNRIVEDWTGAPALPCYDDDLVDWLVSICSDFSLTSTSVSRLRTVQYTAYPDLLNKSVYDALVELTQTNAGAVFWVDDERNLHWTSKGSAQMVPNGTFDDDISGWIESDPSSSFWIADYGPGGTGDGCLGITGDGTGQEDTYSPLIPGVVTGRRYVVKGDVWGDAANVVRVQVRWYDNTPALLSGTLLVATNSVSTWESFSEVVTAPASATGARIFLYIEPGSTASVRYDNIAMIGETAPFGFSTSPDGSETTEMIEWERPTESSLPVNRVKVVGTGVEGWRENAASIAYYGERFEAVLVDQRVTTTDGIDTRAAWAFSQWAFPKYSARVSTYESGFEPGQWVILEDEVVGQKTVEWIASINSRLLGNGLMLHRLTLGVPKEDTASAVAGLATNLNTSIPTPGGGTSLDPGNDTSPPAVPNTPTLETGYSDIVDGSRQPYLLMYWDAVADTDLDAYEVQYEKALGPVSFVPSVSGTGGSLGTGLWYVTVTAVGTGGGETAVDENPQEVDLLTAGERLYVNITALPGAASYKVYAERAADPGLAITTTTTGTNVEVTTEGTTGAAPLDSTAIGWQSPTSSRGSANSHYTHDVEGLAYYGGRVRALDVSGNASDWSNVGTVTILGDESPPTVPLSVNATPGYRLMAVGWSQPSETDVAYHEVRFAPEATVERLENGSFDDDISGWTEVGVPANISHNPSAGPDGSGCVNILGNGIGYILATQNVDDIVPGETYRLSGWCWEDTDQTLRLGLDWRDSSNVNLGYSTAQLGSDALSTWEYRTADFVAPAGADHVTVRAYIGPESTGTVRFDDIEFGQNPATFQWKNSRVDGTVTVIQGLEPDVTYYVQARAVDHSGNVATSVEDDTAVKATDYPEAGWSNDGDVQPYATAMPLLVGAADVAFNSIVTQLLDAGTIDADRLQAGTLTVGGSGNSPDYLIVKNDAAVELLRISEYGLVAIDPDYPTKAMRWWRGRLEFTTDYNAADPNSSEWTSALSADGLVADVITLGSQPGGHNMVENSGFELAPFAVIITKTWTVDADWQAHIAGTDINVTDTGTNSLTLTNGT